MRELSRNRRAFADYTIVDRLEAGIVLSGPEVKSAKSGGMTLAGSYARIVGGELSLINANIRLYAFAPAEAQDPERTRKLLVHKTEIAKLVSRIQEKGLSIIPLEAYVKKGKVKILLGMGRPKKKFDKRDDIKKRETDRSIRRAIRRSV